MPLPKYLEEKVSLNDKSNKGRFRKKSKARETRLAKELKGRVAVNSGATFGQNDVLTDSVEIEDKNIERASYSLKSEYLEEIRRKCAPDKIPVLLVNFESIDRAYAVIPWDDLKYLLER